MKKKTLPRSTFDNNMEIELQSIKALLRELRSEIGPVTYEILEGKN